MRSLTRAHSETIKRSFAAYRQKVTIPPVMAEITVSLAVQRSIIGLVPFSYVWGEGMGKDRRHVLGRLRLVRCSTGHHRPAEHACMCRLLRRRRRRVGRARKGTPRPLVWWHWHGVHSGRARRGTWLVAQTKPNLAANLGARDDASTNPKPLALHNWAQLHTALASLSCS